MVHYISVAEIHANHNVYLDIRVFLGACTIQIAKSVLSDIDFSARNVNLHFFDYAVLETLALLRSEGD